MSLKYTDAAQHLLTSPHCVLAVLVSVGSAGVCPAPGSPGPSCVAVSAVRCRAARPRAKSFWAVLRARHRRSVGRTTPCHFSSRPEGRVGRTGTSKPRSTSHRPLDYSYKYIKSSNALPNRGSARCEKIAGARSSIARTDSSSCLCRRGWKVHTHLCRRASVCRV